MKRIVIWAIGNIILMVFIALTLSGEIFTSLVGFALVGVMTFLYKHSEVARLAIRAYLRTSAQISYSFEKYITQKDK